MRTVCAILFSLLITHQGNSSETSVPEAVVEATTENIAFDQRLDVTSFGEDGELILQVYLRDIFITDALFAIVSDSEIYLPFSELVTLLDLAIETDIREGKAQGWVFEPKNRFRLDLQSGLVSSFDQQFELNDKSISQDDFDLYVNFKDLQKWLPLHFDFNLAALELVIRSGQPLPIELSIARSKKEVNQELVFSANQPYTIPPYRVVDWPAVSVDVGSFASSKTTVPNYDYGIIAHGDFAFMNGRFSVDGNDSEIDNMRMTLGRANPSGMLGPLQLADYEIGDTSQFLPNLIGSSLSGRGVRFGNTRLSAKRDFDTLDLQGELQPGFDVELYVNDKLLGTNRDTEDGLYRFENTPLRLGQNIIRLEFYGPQGQRFTETRRYMVGIGQNRPGQLIYEFASVQPGRQVFEEFNDDIRLKADELPNNQFSTAMDVTYGLSRRATIGVTLAHLADANQQAPTLEESLRNNLTYFNTRLSASISGLNFTYNFATDDEFSSANQLSLRSRMDKTEYNISYTNFNDDYVRFSDRNTSDLSTLPKHHIRGAVNGSLEDRYLGAAVSWSASASYLQNRNDTESATVSARLDGRGRFIGSSWQHQYNIDLDNNIANANGRVAVNLRPGSRHPWSYRASIDYLDRSESYIQDATFGAYRHIGHNGALSFQVSRSIDEKDTDYSASWHQQTRNFRFTSTLSGNDSKELALRLGLNFSVGRESGKYLPAIDGSSRITSPRVGVQVFVDDNGNKEHDASEEVVEGVPITVNGLLSPAVTDQNGYATVTGLSSNTSVDIGIVSSGIRNPELRADITQQGILPRPGRLPIIKIPLIRVRDIEGTVMIGHTPAPGVRVGLRPADGGETINAKTEFDGLFYIPDVPIGKYKLIPDVEQLSELELIATPEIISIDINRNTSIVNEFNFRLHKIDSPHRSTGAGIAALNQSEYVHTASASNSEVAFTEEPVLSAATPASIQIEESEKHIAQPNIQNTIFSPTTLIASRDSDQDGVPSTLDRCPNTRLGEMVNQHGCVYVGSILEGVNFSKGSTVVNTETAFVLNGLARELNANPTLNIQLYTHTDNVGTAQRNMALSIERATSIIKYLVKNGGISSSRMTGKAMGESDPIRSNQTRNGREANRRVVVQVRE
jgi:outer membrane protein OmpA-like peptidoglycan-associated protein